MIGQLGRVRVAGILLFAALAGCGGSCAGTLGSGRSVHTTSDALSLSGSYGKDTATIETAGKKIVIQPAQLVIDDKPVAPINTTATRVQVTVKHGTVTVVADGQSVIKDYQ